MATTEQLLEMSTRGAVVRMVNDENGTFFDGSTSGPLVISPPLSLGGLRTEVELSIRRKLAGDDILPFPGQLAFRYNRLDIEYNLGGKLSGFRPPMPTSTRVLLDEMTRRTGIVFETDDFVLEDINRLNGDPYVLRAKPESLRWVGEIAIVLIDLIDLESLVAGGLPSTPQTLVFEAPVARTKDNQPYLNATAHRKDLDTIFVNDPIVSLSHPLFRFLQKTVGTLDHYLRDVNAVWTVTNSVMRYNASNAVLISKDEIVDGLNVLAPEARHVARIRLSATDLAYGDKDLLIPYAIPSFNNSQFTDAPRFKVTAVVNASNGTNWNVFLNSLSQSSVIVTLPPNMDLRLSGPDRWVADPVTKSPTNLYNAVIQYNGQRRSYDSPSFHPECNRVLVLTVSEFNTAYRGNLTFHYRAPIILNEALPNAILGSNYIHDLAPSEGVAPYVISLVSGGLSSDHTLGTDHRITGMTNIAGNFSVVYDVTDERGVTVRYRLTYKAIVGPITVSGIPLTAAVDQPYDFTFTVSGGKPSYTYRLLDTGGGPGLMISDPTTPRITGTLTGFPSTRSYAIEVTDSRGVVVVHSFTVLVV